MAGRWKASGVSGLTPGFKARSWEALAWCAALQPRTLKTEWVQDWFPGSPATDLSTVCQTLDAVGETVSLLIFISSLGLTLSKLISGLRYTVTSESCISSEEDTAGTMSALSQCWLFLNSGIVESALTLNVRETKGVLEKQIQVLYLQVRKSPQISLT